MLAYLQCHLSHLWLGCPCWNHWIIIFSDKDIHNMCTLPETNPWTMAVGRLSAMSLISGRVIGYVYIYIYLWVKYLRGIPKTSHTSHPSPWDLRWVGLVVQNTHASGTRIILFHCNKLHWKERFGGGWTNKKKVGRIKEWTQIKLKLCRPKIWGMPSKCTFLTSPTFLSFFEGLHLQSTSAPMVTLTPASSSKISSLVVFQEMAFLDDPTTWPKPDRWLVKWQIEEKSVETLQKSVVKLCKSYQLKQHERRFHISTVCI